MGMAGLSWKQVSIDDRDLVLQLMAKYYAYDGLIFDSVVASSALEKFITSPELGQGWLIMLDGMAVGYIVMTNGYSLEFGGYYQFIDEFFLEEAQRGKGLGTETLKYVEDFGRKNGIKSIHLEVGNELAQRFYGKHSYHGHGLFLWTKDIE